MSEQELGPDAPQDVEGHRTKRGKDEEAEQEQDVEGHIRKRG